MSANKSGSNLVVVLLMFLLCVSLVGMSWLLLNLPQQAENLFGEPSPNLGGFQKISLSVRLLLNQDLINLPNNPSGVAEDFEVSAGQTATEVARQLSAAGWIKDADLFLDYLVYLGVDTQIRSGKYRLDPSMNPRQIAAEFRDPTPGDVDFGILPGWRLEEIAAVLPSSGLNVTTDQFMLAAANPGISDLPLDWLPAGSLEGYLFPGVYTFPRQTDADTMIRVFTRRFKDQMTSELLNGFQNQGLSVQQAVILASIVQKEAVITEEQPLVAAVFLNRLAAGMNLGSDPTVQYALGYQVDSGSWWKNPLYTNDLTVISPYNTYQNQGLPPGPICSPGLSALEAVANPQQTSYYYFRAACDGSGRHLFAETYDAHLNNACQ